MTVVLGLGTRTQSVMEFGNGDWRLARTVEFLIEPTTPETAVAHCAMCDDGVIVLAERGPRGGWKDLRYVRGLPVEQVAKLTRERTHRFVHMGWLLRKA